MMRRKNYQKHIVLVLVFIVVFLLLYFLLVNIFPQQIENSFLLAKRSITRGISDLPKLFSQGEFSRMFFTLTADSFFLRFGWMAFAADKFFYYIWRLFVLFSIAGTAVYGVKFISTRLKKNFQNFGNSVEFKLLLFSIVAIAGQILGLWIFYGVHGILVQGRHLFPLILPIAVVILVGVKSFFDLISKKAGRIALCAFVLFEFVFFSFVLWNYVVPVFHLALKSPHPGV